VIVPHCLTVEDNEIPHCTLDHCTRVEENKKRKIQKDSSADIYFPRSGNQNIKITRKKTKF
jgi:hypothetical protein